MIVISSPLQPIPLTAFGVNKPLKQFVIEGEPDIIEAIIAQLAKFARIQFTNDYQSPIAGWIGKKVCYVERD